MKIAIACADVRPESSHGGIAVYTRNLATGLVSRGHEVTILGSGTEISEVWSKDGVRTLFLPPIRRLRLHPKLDLLTNKLARSRTLSSYLRCHPDFDIVEFPVWDAEGLYPVNLKTFKSVVRGHTPHVIVNELAEKAGQRVARLDRIAERLERSAARKADLYLANSQSSSKIAVERFGIPPNRITTCLHGIPSQLNPNDIGGENPTALFVGRLEVRKGVLELFDAIPQIVAACPGIEFEIVGSDSEFQPGKTFEEFFRESVLGPIQQRVHFRGRLSGSEIDQIRRRSSIAILPSRYESFGLVHAESMSFGLPVVAFDISATREVVETGVNGLLVPDGDSQGLAHAVIQLARDEAARVRMGRAAFDTASTKFSIEAMTSCVESAYRSLIQVTS